jgi:hypothetical protein
MPRGLERDGPVRAPTAPQEPEARKGGIEASSGSPGGLTGWMMHLALDAGTSGRPLRVLGPSFSVLGSVCAVFFRGHGLGVAPSAWTPLCGPRRWGKGPSSRYGLQGVGWRRRPWQGSGGPLRV